MCCSVLQWLWFWPLTSWFCLIYVSNLLQAGLPGRLQPVVSCDVSGEGKGLLTVQLSPFRAANSPLGDRSAWTIKTQTAGMVEESLTHTSAAPHQPRAPLDPPQPLTFLLCLPTGCCRPRGARLCCPPRCVCVTSLLLLAATVAIVGLAVALGLPPRSPGRSCEGRRWPHGGGRKRCWGEQWWGEGKGLREVALNWSSTVETPGGTTQAAGTHQEDTGDGFWPLVISRWHKFLNSPLFWFWNLHLFPIPSVSMRLSENSVSCFPFSKPPLCSLQ